MQSWLLTLRLRLRGRPRGEGGILGEVDNAEFLSFFFFGGFCCLIAARG